MLKKFTIVNLQVLGKLWSALPLEEKDKYERKVEKQRVDQEKQRLDNERQKLQEAKTVADETNAAEKSDGRKSEERRNSGEQLSQLSEVPDPYLIFSSEVRGEVLKRNPTLSKEKVLYIFHSKKIYFWNSRWRQFWKRCGG